MKQLILLAMFVALPFIIAAAFKYSDWLGLPTLIVCGLHWLGVCFLLGGKK